MEGSRPILGCDCLFDTAWVYAVIFGMNMLLLDWAAASNFNVLVSQMAVLVLVVSLSFILNNSLCPGAENENDLHRHSLL